MNDNRYGSRIWRGNVYFPQIYPGRFHEIVVVQGACSDANALLMLLAMTNVKGNFENIVEALVNACRHSNEITTWHRRKGDKFNWRNEKSDINSGLFWTIRDYVISLKAILW